MNRPLRRLVASLCVSAESTAVCADQGESPFPTSTGLWGAAVPAAPAEGNNLVGYGGVPAGAPEFRWPNQGYSGSYQPSAREAAIGNGIKTGVAQFLLLPVMVVLAPVAVGLLTVKGIEYAATHGDAARPQD